MKRSLFLGACAIVAAATSSACSSSSGTVNGCTTFTDETASGAVITGPSGASPAQFSPACVHITAGQTVTWNADFTNHPLEPTSGVGTQPNPITPTSSGSTVTFTFPNAGTFAYNCGIHTATM